MAHLSKRLFVVNLFGALFYLFCLLQWAWSLLPFVPNIIRFMNSFQSPSKPAITHVVRTTSASEPSTALLVFGIATAIIIIGLTIWVLIKLPSTVGKTGHQLTNRASNYIVSATTKHVHLSAKKKQRLIIRITTDIKLALCIMPTILGACTYFIATSLPYDITMFIVAILGMMTLVLLNIQVAVAHWLKVRLDTAW